MSKRRRFYVNVLTMVLLFNFSHKPNTRPLIYAYLLQSQKGSLSDACFYAQHYRWYALSENQMHSDQKHHQEGELAEVCSLSSFHQDWKKNDVLQSIIFSCLLCTSFPNSSLYLLYNTFTGTFMHASITHMQEYACMLSLSLIGLICLYTHWFRIENKSMSSQWLWEDI